MVVLFQQYAENKGFFSNLSAGGLHDWGVLVIPLEFQEIKHQPFPMAQPNEKGAVPSPYCGSETNASPKKTRFRHSAWLFHLHSTVDIRPFSPVFSSADFMAETFYWLSPWNFKEKGINHFYGTAKNKRCLLPHSSARGGRRSRRYADEVRPAFKGFFKGCVIENG